MVLDRSQLRKYVEKVYINKIQKISNSMLKYHIPTDVGGQHIKVTTKFQSVLVW